MTAENDVYSIPANLIIADHGVAVRGTQYTGYSTVCFSLAVITPALFTTGVQILSITAEFVNLEQQLTHCLVINLVIDNNTMLGPLLS